MINQKLAMRPAIFFDRDGVLNIDKGYVYRREEFRWVPGAKEALQLASDQGYLSIVVTNQSGIARGYYTLSDMHSLHDWMNKDLEATGAKIDFFYYCPYHADGTVHEFVVSDHPDRKPNPGMILKAAKEHNIDLKKSLLIGDKPSDIEAAERAGVASILFRGEDLSLTLKTWISAQGLSIKPSKK